METSLNVAIFTAAAAAAGYVAKQLIELSGSFVATIRSRRNRLLKLYSLLRAGRVVFEVQNRNARGLLDMVERNHPGKTSEGGFEKTFSALVGEFTPQEKEWHALIRAQTNALYGINSDLAKWLTEDDYFKVFRSTFVSARSAKRKRLAALLAALEAHLLLWNAKYDSWIPEHPEHALLYLADEELHGIGFPAGLDDLVAELVGAR
jgi:hypothetical protein